MHRWGHWSSERSDVICPVKHSCEVTRLSRRCRQFHPGVCSWPACYSCPCVWRCLGFLDWAGHASPSQPSLSQAAWGMVFFGTHCGKCAVVMQWVTTRDRRKLIPNDGFRRTEDRAGSTVGEAARPVQQRRPAVPTRSAAEWAWCSRGRQTLW